MPGVVDAVCAGPTVVAEAPPASSDNPATPNTGTAFFAGFRFDACFARGIVCPSMPYRNLSFSTSFVRSEKALGKIASRVCPIIHFLSHSSCFGSWHLCLRFMVEWNHFHVCAAQLSFNSKELRLSKVRATRIHDRWRVPTIADANMEQREWPITMAVSSGTS
jgi:hypothetical protein